MHSVKSREREKEREREVGKELVPKSAIGLIFREVVFVLITPDIDAEELTEKSSFPALFHPTSTHLPTDTSPNSVAAQQARPSMNPALRLIFGSLNSLKQLRDKVVGQHRSCLQFVDLCLSIEPFLSSWSSSVDEITPSPTSLPTPPPHDDSPKILKNLKALNDFLVRCHEICLKFTGKGWIRTAFEVLRQPTLFSDLHLELINLCSALGFQISVGDEHETTQLQLDLGEIISSVKQFLEVIGPEAIKKSPHLTDLMKTSLEFTEVSKLQTLPLNPETLERLLRYETTPDQTLGVGGFGSVYRGRYGKGRNKAEVAVKVLNGIDERDKLSISREVRVMAKAQHPNVTKLVGYSFAKRLIVMELANCSLSDVLSGKTTTLPKSYLQSMSDVLSCFVDILSGLRYLHYHEILHRDLKPHNILLILNRSTRSVVAKITDFGLATMSSLSLSKTRNGPVGSMAYLAPELFKNKPMYSEKSDMYAVGIIFNEMLTREAPDLDLGLGAFLGQAFTGDRTLTQWHSQFAFDAELASVIGSEGCLSVDPVRRPSAMDFLKLTQAKLSSLSPAFSEGINQVGE
jgi:hypothetical protein